jgi:hypothetical protein
MARFDHNTYRSLNASISQVQNPQAALDEALEYASFLEGVLETLCEEMGLDPVSLLEDVQTFERERETQAETQGLIRQSDAGRRKNTAAGDKEVRSAEAKLRHRAKRDAKERASKQLYGKGGKVIRKGTKKYKSEIAKSKKQEAADDKIREMQFRADEDRFRRNNSNWREIDRLAGGGWR